MRILFLVVLSRFLSSSLSSSCIVTATVTFNSVRRFRGTSALEARLFWIFARIVPQLSKYQRKFKRAFALTMLLWGMFTHLL